MENGCDPVNYVQRMGQGLTFELLTDGGIKIAIRCRDAVQKLESYMYTLFFLPPLVVAASVVKGGHCAVRSTCQQRCGCRTLDGRPDAG